MTSLKQLPNRAIFDSISEDGEWLIYNLENKYYFLISLGDLGIYAYKRNKDGSNEAVTIEWSVISSLIEKRELFLSQ